MKCPKCNGAIAEGSMIVRHSVLYDQDGDGMGKGSDSNPDKTLWRSKTLQCVECGKRINRKEWQ